MYKCWFFAWIYSFLAQATFSHIWTVYAFLNTWPNCKAKASTMINSICINPCIACWICQFECFRTTNTKIIANINTFCIDCCNCFWIHHSWMQKQIQQLIHNELLFVLINECNDVFFNQECNDINKYHCWNVFISTLLLNLFFINTMKNFVFGMICESISAFIFNILWNNTTELCLVLCIVMYLLLYLWILCINYCNYNFLMILQYNYQYKWIQTHLQWSMQRKLKILTGTKENCWIHLCI